jgi:hypothetical protein
VELHDAIRPAIPRLMDLCTDPDEDVSVRSDSASALVKLAKHSESQ